MRDTELLPNHARMHTSIFIKLQRELCTYAYASRLALHSALCAGQWASWHACLQYRALQPGFEQCALASRYSVSVAGAPNNFVKSAAVPKSGEEAWGLAPCLVSHLTT
jgi:hypothetical protein